MFGYKDTGEKSDESSFNASASFTCEQRGKTFNSRQGLREHTHQFVYLSMLSRKLGFREANKFIFINTA